MRRQRRKDERIQHGPRQKEVQHFVRLLLKSLVVDFLFWVFILQGPLLLLLALAGFIAAREFGFGFHTRHLWSAILATVLVVPLYYLRKNIERRLDEARYQLEQIGPPEPSEETGTSHTT